MRCTVVVAVLSRDEQDEIETFFRALRGEQDFTAEAPCWNCAGSGSVSGGACRVCIGAGKMTRTLARHPADAFRFGIADTGSP